MVFSSLTFLFAFFPALILIFFLIPARWNKGRQGVLLAFSILFYGLGEPFYIFVIVICIVVTWLLSKKIENGSMLCLVLGLGINIVPLLITKYLTFIMENISSLIGGGTFEPYAIVMPIGISFYTFQVITYIVDVYMHRVKREENIMLFALYISFFPQLVAGPIVKYEEVEMSLKHPDVTWDGIKYGVGRVIKGLGKKVLIANQAGYITETLMACSSDSLSRSLIWLCVLAYTIQIFFDFSGYSEMAIGLGSIFGFKFPENFNTPYCSSSIREFWGRWHMTLGRFFREYVYIPLGGNRVSSIRWIINMLIVWALTGLWHGAAWNYIIWGAYYGALLIVEKFVRRHIRIPAVLGWFMTFFVVVFGWAIFMCDGYTISETVNFIKYLFVEKEVINPVSISSLKLWGYIPFVIVGLILATPLHTCFLNVRKIMKGRITSLANDLMLIAIFLLSIVFLVGSTYNPFIYFRF